MTDNIMVLQGSDRVDLTRLHTVAEDFGWAVDVAHDLREVAAGRAHQKTVAVLFSRDALGAGNSWDETISLLRLALPGVRLVACRGFSDSIDWPELSDAGVFHALWLPLKENEVRRTFGFVWEAEQRHAAREKPFVPQRREARKEELPCVFANDRGRTRALVCNA